MTKIPQMDSSLDRQTRRQLRAQKTRKRLLAAARQVFAQRGMDMTRIDEITEAADVGKGTFYNYFHSKEDLINELIRQVLDELSAVIDRRCRGISDLKGLLDALIGAHIEFFCSRWEDFVLYFQCRTDLILSAGYAGIDMPFLKYLARIQDLLRPVLSYSLPDTTVRRAACALAGFVSGYYSFAVLASEGEDVDAVFGSLRGAFVASFARFVQETAPGPEQGAKPATA